MIDDLSKTLKFILTLDDVKKEFPQLGHAEIAFARPVKDFKPKPPQTVCLFLYDIRENRELRSNEPLRVSGNGNPSVERPPMRVDCSYLVTAWPAETAVTVAANGVDSETAADTDLLEQLLLSQVLQVFARYPVIPPEILQGKLADPKQDYPPPMITARAEGLSNISEFWTAVGSSLRPSLNVRVTISVQVAAPSPEARPVTERVLLEENPARLDIAGHVRDDRGAPVEGARVAIQELGLSTVSGQDGGFGFSRVPLGKYSLRVNWKTDAGVKSKTAEINVPAAAGAYDVELKG